MLNKVAVVYNEPAASRYTEIGEAKAINGVLDEVKAAYRALADLGYTVTRVPLHPPLAAARERLHELQVDLVFNLFEGFEGRAETEAIVAGYIEELGVKYTGCSSAALADAQDKPGTRATLLAAGVRAPQYQVLTPATVSEFRLNYPCIVKPAGEHASHGISRDSVVADATALERQVKKVSELYGGRAMVEQFLEGREFNATVMGNNKLVVLPPSEIVFTLPPGLPKLLTFAAKWEAGDPYFIGTTAQCPAKIDNALKEQIAQASLAAFKCLGCRSYARVDMRLDAGGQVAVLEVNPNPDISPQYGAARQARSAGMSYNEFIKKIVSLAWEGD